MPTLTQSTSVAVERGLSAAITHGRSSDSCVSARMGRPCSYIRCVFNCKLSHRNFCVFVCIHCDAVNFNSVTATMPSRRRTSPPRFSSSYSVSMMQRMLIGTRRRPGPRRPRLPVAAEGAARVGLPPPPLLLPRRRALLISVIEIRVRLMMKMALEEQVCLLF